MRTTLLPGLVLLSLLSVGCDKPAPAADVDASSPTAASAAPSASSTSAVDAAPPARPTGKTVETPAGVASEVGSEIQLAGKTIYPPECPAGGKDGCAKVKGLWSATDGVKLLRHFDGPGGPKSILLLQVMPAGNACNGGPLFFVRVAKDALPQYSDVFDHCGGPDPMVGAMPDKILINVPAHPPNRGAWTIAAKNMEYDIATGALQAAAPAKKKK
ncbi:hypothetical protein BH11MYX4_BH11MYX4_02510 [soil metagenome]